MSYQTVERLTDLSPQLYRHRESRRVIESPEQVIEDLWTWWAEADLRPSPIRLFVDGDRLTDKYGYDLVLQAEAASIIRKGKVEEGRVNAETEGVRNLRKLLVSKDVTDGVIYISPPGSKEEGFGDVGRRRLSFTYLYHKGNAGRIHFLAIPELEIGIEEHLGRIAHEVDQGKTNEILNSPLGGLTDRDLVSHPFVLNNSETLNSIALKFGYDSLLGLWKDALEAKKLRGRVGELIKHVGGEIWNAYRELDTERLETLGDVYRGVVALAVSNGLDDIDDLSQYFDESVTAILQSRKLDSLGGVNYTLYEKYSSRIADFYWRIRNNNNALGIMEGGACPGDRSFGFGVDLLGGREKGTSVTNNVLLDALGGRFGEEAKSEETYSFDHEGKCVVCKNDPRMLGPCNICEECDHKLRSQEG